MLSINISPSNFSMKCFRQYFVLSKCLCYVHMHVICLQESIRFYDSKGLGDLPQILMNGVQVDTDEVVSSSYSVTSTHTNQ